MSAQASIRGPWTASAAVGAVAFGSGQPGMPRFPSWQARWGDRASSRIIWCLRFFSGRLSAPFAKTIATLAQRDIRRAQNAGPEFTFADLNMVAGLKKGNEYEVLKSKLPPPLVMVRSIRVPLKLSFAVKRVTDYPIVWPHELFSGLFLHYNREWRSRVLPDKNMLPAFWEALAGHPMLRIHPMVREVRWNEVFIGIVIMVIMVIQYDGITHVRVI